MQMQLRYDPIMAQRRQVGGHCVYNKYRSACALLDFASRIDHADDRISLIKYYITQANLLSAHCVLIQNTTAALIHMVFRLAKCGQHKISGAGCKP
jgi:hypothetical protein